MTEEFIISLQKVQFFYDPGKVVLNELSFDINKGSITAILGPNGTGKTTLLHTMLGLLSCQSGEIFILGKELSNYQRREFSHILALVPQMEIVPFNFYS